MNLRWLWFDYVPPDLKLSRAQKRQVKQIVFQLPGARERFFLVVIFGALIPLIAFYLIVELLSPSAVSPTTPP